MLRVLLAALDRHPRKAQGAGVDAPGVRWRRRRSSDATCADGEAPGWRAEVVIVTVETANVPHIPPTERATFDRLGYDHDGYSHITLRFGYLDRPAVTSALALARRTPPGLEVDFNPYHATYFLSQITIVPVRGQGMAWWRKKLFVAMARNAANPADYFDLPAERVVTLGSRIRV